MKKHIFFFAVLLLTAQMVWADVTPPAEIPAYWESVDGKAGTALFNELSVATGVGYKSLGYDGLWTAYAKTDVYPADSVDRAGEIWDTYSACHFAVSQHGSYSKECDKYNREHTVPQSWWGKGTSNQGCDIFHVIPTDGYVNNWRGNDPYGEVSTAQKKSTNGCKSGPSAREGYNGTVFEMADQYKGDIARGILGSMVKWKGNWTQAQGSSTFTGTYTADGHFGLTQYAVDLFMKWHREDPVSQKEIDRNNGIQDTQGNRNPFIDYPYLAEYIWGEHAGETVDMSKLMASTDPDFIPGVSEGWRTDTLPPTPPEPPVPVTKYGVTWSANGEELYTDSIPENGPVIELPLPPVSCSTESDIFVGWTDMPINGTMDEAPAVLYVNATEFPAVTEDVTYYAVFAKETISEGTTPVTYVYVADNQEGWMNTAENKGSYWLLKQDVYLESPVVDLAGLDSIIMTIRTYGGSDNNTVSVMAGEDEIATLTAANKTLTNYTWTNTGTLLGLLPLRFVAEKSATQGVGFSSVTVHVAGAGISYSRYITFCQGTEELELVETEAPVRKILVGSHLYIMYKGTIYNVQGARVR